MEQWWRGLKKNEFGQSSLSKMEMMVMMTVVVVVLNIKSVLQYDLQYWEETSTCICCIAVIL